MTRKIDIEALCADKGLRITEQRKVIARVLGDSEDHPDVETLHARAAAKLVALAERYSACMNVSRGGQSVPACSIMGLMMLGAGHGSEITVDAEGFDAREALDAVAGLIEAGFHED